MRATVDVVSTLGYADTRVEQIVEASGLSRTVFYRHFGGKRPAVLAAAGRILDRLDRAVRAALVVYDDRTPDGSMRSAGPPPASAGDAPDRSRAGLQALTDTLAADPPAAAVLFLEAPAAGPDARPLRAELVALLRQVLGDGDPLPGTVGRRRPLAWPPEMRAGALHEVLHRRIAHGDVTSLSALVPDLVWALGDGPRGG